MATSTAWPTPSPASSSSGVVQTGAWTAATSRGKIETPNRVKEKLGQEPTIDQLERPTFSVDDTVNTRIRFREQVATPRMSFEQSKPKKTESMAPVVSRAEYRQTVRSKNNENTIQWSGRSE